MAETATSSVLFPRFQFEFPPDGPDSQRLVHDIAQPYMWLPPWVIPPVDQPAFPAELIDVETQIDDIGAWNGVSHVIQTTDRKLIDYEDEQAATGGRFRLTVLDHTAVKVPGATQARRREVVLSEEIGEEDETVERLALLIPPAYIGSAQQLTMDYRGIRIDGRFYPDYEDLKFFIDVVKAGFKDSSPEVNEG